MRWMVFLAAALAHPAAAQIHPDAGAVTGGGTLADKDGNQGRWQMRGTLARGTFDGTIDMVLGGKSLSVTMKNAYVENGFCVLRGENGRSRFELRGKCDPATFGPGTISGYFNGDRSFGGTFTGALRWGAAAAVPAASGVVPSAKLLCAYRERIGGNVAGDPARYEMRPSAMVFLELAGGTYRTRNTSGRYTVSGNRLRLTSGGFAGAIGELRADSSGTPTVHFAVEANRGANGVPIVDAWNTACAVQTVR